MEDADGGFSFDFEGGLDAAVAANAAAPSAGGQIISTVAAAGLGQSTGGAPAAGPGQGGRRNFRQTVCRHWLRGLCMKGEACGFLHQLDKSRMPICRFFGKYGECHEPDCGYKHSYEDVKECNMYKLGFCPNGPDCRYRHVKLPGPFPPLEESLQKIQLRSTAGQSRQNGRYLTQRQGYNTFEDAAQPLPSAPQPQPVVNGEDAQTAPPPPLPTQDVRQQKQPEEEVQLPPPPPLPPTQQRPPGLEQQTEYGQAQVQPVVQQTVSNGTGSQAQTFVSASSPLPQGFSRYFIVKSSNRENLELSVARGLWATHRNNEAKLNDAFDSCDNVILIFSVNETGHFQGCARMMSKIGVIVGGGGWKYAHGTAHYGRNFRLKWLKLCELSFNKTRHLRNPYKENLPVKISRDCQELEPSVGEKLASLFYMEPDSDLMKIAKEAELRWEEERARGLTSAQDTEDTNIVPYEDNDEDQEDEDSDEDDSSNQTVGQSRRPNLGRGGDSLEVARRKPRGRGRSMSGDTYAVGYDRFVSGTSNGYKIPGMSGGRGFPPYQAMPRYAGPGAAMGFGHIDGPVLASGMVLSGRPPNGIFGHTGSGLMGPPGAALMPGVRPANVMGATRPHFIGVPGAGQHGRSGGLPFRPSQTSNWGRRGISEQQRRQRSESNTGGDRPPSSGEPRNVDKPIEQFPAEETYPQGKLESRALAQRQDGDFASESYGRDDDDSLSEDEAPRRSRYGEGKKRRRD